MKHPVEQRPGISEYATPHQTYVDKVPAGNVLATCAAQQREVDALLRPLSEAKAAWAYAPGKWSIKEVVGHLNDAERVFSYRATWIARGDTTPLPGFDENAWIPFGRFQERTLESLLDEWAAIRASTLALFLGLPAEAAERRGVASGHPVSVRGLAHVICGHVIHHLGVIRERYL